VLTVSRANFSKFLALLPDFEQRVKVIAELRTKTNELRKQPTAEEKLKQSAWRRASAPAKLLIQQRLANRENRANTERAGSDSDCDDDDAGGADGMPSISDIYDFWKADSVATVDKHTQPQGGDEKQARDLGKVLTKRASLGDAAMTMLAAERILRKGA
jgi:hypothetical protein